MTRPDSLAVVPMLFRRRPAGTAAERAVAGYEPQTNFAEGMPWTA